MRAAATAVLVLVVAPFLQACPAYLGDCAREEVPEFSATEEQITRNDVVADLGEPIETIKSENGRVDVYEYDGHCGGLFWLLPIPYPLPVAYGTDQMLTVEYGPDGSFLTAQVWPDAETPEEAIASYKRQAERQAERRVRETERRAMLEACTLPFSEAIKLDARTQYERAVDCSGIGLGLPVTWRWRCLAAHQGDDRAQNHVGNYYRVGSTPIQQDFVEAYKWYSLAVANGNERAVDLRHNVSGQMTPVQLAEAERLVTEWEPNPAECEVEGEQAEN